MQALCRDCGQQCCAVRCTELYTVCQDFGCGDFWQCLGSVWRHHWDHYSRAGKFSGEVIPPWPAANLQAVHIDWWQYCRLMPNPNRQVLADFWWEFLLPKSESCWDFLLVGAQTKLLLDCHLMWLYVNRVDITFRHSSIIACLNGPQTMSFGGPHAAGVPLKVVQDLHVSVWAGQHALVHIVI